MPQFRSALLVLALLGVTSVAFVTTEHLKVQAVPVEATNVPKAVSPVCRCATAQASIRFVVRRAETLSLGIVDAQGRPVRQLAAGEHLQPGRPAFLWDGRDASGQVVPDGTYRLRLRLEREARVIQVPQAIVVDTVPPVTKVVALRPRIVAAGARPRVVVRYRISEPARAVLFVDGVRRLLTYRSARTGEFQWFAQRHGKRLAPGRYRLQLAGLDAAGNLGKRTRPFIVRVR